MTESKRVTRDDVAATFGMEQRELDEWFDALPDPPASADVDTLPKSIPGKGNETRVGSVHPLFTPPASADADAAWWRDDCTCPVTSPAGDTCSLSYPAGSSVQMCEHCQGHAIRAESGLDVRRVKQAVVNVAKRHGITGDMPVSVSSIFGYSRATPDMDAEIAAEYARLAEAER